MAETVSGLKIIDVHSHYVPKAFPPSPVSADIVRWPAMTCCGSGSVITFGGKPFRELDDRSWDIARRLGDMDADGVAIQVLSPMPELLSYWLADDHSESLCDFVNGEIAAAVANRTDRFMGLGMVPMQQPRLAVRHLRRLRDQFGLAGVEIGSNVNGMMLGDARFDDVYAAAEELGLAVFVHALHPIISKAADVPQSFTPFAGFPLDTGAAAASIIMSGVMARFPRLRIGFSHGGGVLGSMLGRLDKGWQSTGGYWNKSAVCPSEQARTMFFDSNIYDPALLRFLSAHMAPGNIFLGTDYPYAIMQADPACYLKDAAVDDAELRSLAHQAAEAFLNIRKS